eukprot:scaffold462_cov195-Pinguiococcus_pyrenoidosus.AAC.71
MDSHHPLVKRIRKEGLSPVCIHNPLSLNLVKVEAERCAFLLRVDGNPEQICALVHGEDALSLPMQAVLVHSEAQQGSREAQDGERIHRLLVGTQEVEREGERRQRQDERVRDAHERRRGLLHQQQA